MGAERMKYEFIVNPQARSGMGGMIWDMICPELKKRNVDHTVRMTRRRRHAERIANEITADGEEHLIVVLGGDGTVNEVLNGLNAPEKITLGYIPIGSSNDFARGLGIPGDPMKALAAVLKQDRVIEMDVGEMTRAGRQRRFAVSAGIGFDAAVCHEVCVSRWKVLLNRLNLGKLSYAAVALDQLVRSRPANACVTVDGRRRVFEKMYFAAFMNLPYEGGGFKFCPRASAADGQLDVMIAAGLPKLKILLLLPTAFWGKHTGFKGVTILRGRHVTVESEKPLPLHTDGEPSFLRRNTDVRLAEGRMKVIVG